MNLSDLFLQPERLWMLAVVPVLILAYVLATRRRKRTGMRFTNTAVLGRVVRKQSQWRRHLAVALSLLSLITLVLAWARPNGVDRVPRERATIVLVIDVSQSMAATDVAPTRMAAAKAAANAPKRVTAKYFGTSGFAGAVGSTAGLKIETFACSVCFSRLS